jgi:tetratricopeptide (TPR) repeat protein
MRPQHLPIHLRLRMPWRHPLRSLALVGLGAVAMGLSASAASAADEGQAPHVIQAPHYGDVVFHFFQADHFTAITTLMASQHFQRIAPHDDEAEVLRGGMLLSYGVHSEAGEIFARLIERGNTTPAVRDRAWFYLAKVRYHKGQFAMAEDALARVQAPLPGNMEEERGLLHAQLLMARADYAGAAQALKAMTDQSPGARFARFNLGVAQIKSGDRISGTGTLDELGREPADTPEQRALRDRTNVALGFAALAASQPAAARRYLERVPMEGPESNKALLGYGWAALDLRAPQFALVPWLMLNEREGNDASILESRIAVPYAYAKLGANRKALQQYAAAIRSFERERLSLDASIASIQSGQLVNALLSLNPRGELGEGWRMDELPDVPHASHLTGLLAQHAFQEAFKNLRDLRSLNQQLQAWRDKVDMFKDMLDTRRQAFAKRLQQACTGAGEQRIQGLSQRIDAVAADIAQGESSMDGMAFADARERGLLARVARAQAITQQADASPEIAQARDRVRLVAGVLNWQLAQSHPARLWEAQKAMQGMKAGLAQAQLQVAAITQAMQDEPQRFDRFGARIQALTPLLDVMIPKLAALGAEQQTVVQDIAVAELTRQKESLATYTVQARYAVAQLFDHAAVSNAADAMRPVYKDIERVRPGEPLGVNKGASDAP